MLDFNSRSSPSHPGCPTNVHAAIWVWQPGGMIHVHSSKCCLHLLWYWLPMVAELPNLNSKVQFPCALVLLLVCVPEAIGEMDPLGWEKCTSTLDVRFPYFIAFYCGWCTNLEVHTQMYRILMFHLSIVNFWHMCAHMSLKGLKWIRAWLAHIKDTLWYTSQYNISQVYITTDHNIS